MITKLCATAINFSFLKFSLFKLERFGKESSGGLSDIAVLNSQLFDDLETKQNKIGTIENEVTEQILLVSFFNFELLV
jgi:hypothetical protein